VNRPADGWDAEERAALDAMGPALRELQSRHEGDPPLELLRAAQADVLPDDLRADAMRLLDASPWHRALVDGADAAEPSLTADDRQRLLRRIQGARAQDAAPAATRRWLWQPALAAAAVVVVAAGAAWMLRTRVPDVGPGEKPEATIAVATPPAPVVPAPAPAYRLPLDQPQIKVSAAALIYRGASDENRLLADLKPAFDALRAGDHAAAVRDLSELLDRYPMAIEVPYYLGVSQLFLNDAERALANLARAARLADSSFASDVAWYQAVANERSGHTEEARRLLRTLCQQKGARSVQACAAETTLSPPPNSK
jgi:TolA-binding protein